MANQILIKRSAVASKVPATTDLALGELGLNTFDGKLFLKKNNGTDAIVEIGANTFTGDATGSGNGSIALTLAATGVTAGTYNSVTVDAKGRATSGSNIAYLTGNQTVSVSGDATGSGTTAIALTLAASGVTAGTYSKVTVDTKGRVTVGAAISAADVTTALGFSPVNKAGDTLTGALNGAPTVSMASAATVSLGSAASNDVLITGTTGISSFGVAPAGTTRTVTFASSVTITKGAGSGILVPGGDNLYAVAGDIGEFTSQGGGTWRCNYFTRLAGVSPSTFTKVTLNALGQIVSGSNINSSDVTTALGFTPIASSTNQNITVTGDATGSGTTAIALTLATSGVTAGTYTSVTVDAKGRVTSGTNPGSVADASTLIGTTLAANVVSSSLTTLGTLSGLTINGIILPPAVSGATTGIDISIKGGASTSGTGGRVLLAGGVSSAGQGGDINATAGTGFNSGGAVSINGGQVSTSSGSPGAVTIQGGAQLNAGSSFTPGSASIVGGFTNVAGLTAGIANVTGGQSTSGTGGNAQIQGGLGSTAGGAIVISTAPTGSLVERLRILNNGAWSVGTGGAATGTTGQVLASTGSSTAPAWTSIASALGFTPVNKAGDTFTGPVAMTFSSNSVNAAFAAAGTTQATATAIATAIVVVTTGTGGVVLPTVAAGTIVTVINVTGAAINVYPQTSSQIDALGVNAAFSLGSLAKLEYVSISTTQWYALTGVYA